MAVTFTVRVSVLIVHLLSVQLSALFAQSCVCVCSATMQPWTSVRCRLPLRCAQLLSTKYKDKYKTRLQKLENPEKSEVYRKTFVGEGKKRFSHLKVRENYKASLAFINFGAMWDFLGKFLTNNACQIFNSIFDRLENCQNYGVLERATLVEIFKSQ